ncbi:hypothetical protein FB451DRAFT_1513351 [Mycena latifolia]|nr:hypothetical protein FB451DRAFT_1513351 [Mycena latifolia]
MHHFTLTADTVPQLGHISAKSPPRALKNSISGQGSTDFGLKNSIFGQGNGQILTSKAQFFGQPSGGASRGLWKGEIQCRPDIQVGTFDMGVLKAQDFMVVDIFQPAGASKIHFPSVREGINAQVRRPVVVNTQVIWDTIRGRNHNPLKNLTITALNDICSFNDELFLNIPSGSGQTGGVWPPNIGLNPSEQYLSLWFSGAPDGPSPTSNFGITSYTAKTFESASIFLPKQTLKRHYYSPTGIQNKASEESGRKAFHTRTILRGRGQGIHGTMLAYWKRDDLLRTLPLTFGLHNELLKIVTVDMGHDNKLTRTVVQIALARAMKEQDRKLLHEPHPFFRDGNLVPGALQFRAPDSHFDWSDYFLELAQLCRGMFEPSSRARKHQGQAHRREGAQGDADLLDYVATYEATPTDDQVGVGVEERRHKGRHHSGMSRLGVIFPAIN